MCSVCSDSGTSGRPNSGSVSGNWPKSATVGKPTPQVQVIHFFNRKLPGGLPAKTPRQMLGLTDPKVVPVVRAFDDTAQLVAALPQGPAARAVLVKGSRFMKMERVSDAIVSEEKD